MDIPSNCLNKSPLTKTFKPQLHGRPVFGSISNQLQNIQSSEILIGINGPNKSTDHPSRRRRKFPISEDIENRFAKSTRHCYQTKLVAGSDLNLKVEKNIKSTDTSNSSPECNQFDSPSKEIQQNQSCDNNNEKFECIVAFDFIRAVFTKNIPLEDFLTECRCVDFSVSAMDRSATARMMEATDYVISIMAYEQSRELKACFQINDFIENRCQLNITEDMIITLADWMVEVQENFVFNHETMYLAWGLLYAFFDNHPSIQRSEIQLMACASIMIACKQEERHMPRMCEFLYITDNAYARERFLEAERCLLTAIDFNVHRPNPYVFLRRYARVLDAHNGKVQFTARFLLEAGMHSHKISLFRQSKKAAAVLWLARKVLCNPSYTEWLRRPEIKALQHLVKTNDRLKFFYQYCHPTNETASKKLPLEDQTQFEMHQKPALIRSRSVGSGNIEWKTYSIPGNSDIIMKNDNICCSPGITEELTKIQVSSIKRSLSEISEQCIPNQQHAKGNILDAELLSKLRKMRDIEIQRKPLWPLILQHITGYTEVELIPLALEYHKIALRLLAEVARGGNLENKYINSSPQDMPGQRESTNAIDLSERTVSVTNCELDPSTSRSCSSDTNCVRKETSDVPAPRCVSPGGHHLRRRVITKYCSASFLGVADAYPQLSFENLIPFFPTIQCTDNCACFVCQNLIKTGQHDSESEDFTHESMH